MARAGRSGTAYSLVAPDEVPYLLDLHLFLGRALTLARPHEGPSGEQRPGHRDRSSLWVPCGLLVQPGVTLSWLGEEVGLDLAPGRDPRVLNSGFHIKIQVCDVFWKTGLAVLSLPFPGVAVQAVLGHMPG